MNLRFAPEAIDYLTWVRKFINEKNPVTVERIANLILGMEKLEVFPEISLKVECAFEPDRKRDL